MSLFKKHMTCHPTNTTATTTWAGLQILNPLCYRCDYCMFISGKPVCYCSSRTLRCGVYGDTCESYRKVKQ